MRKYLISIFFIVTGFTCFAQSTQKVELISSQLSKGFTAQGLIRIIRPVFSHEGSTLSSDSANFDQKRNTFDAFGNIVITQPNGTTVYSDLLKYNGNNKVAVLTRNVRLIDGDATLTTELLTYNIGTKIGTYLGGGKIVNGSNVLTSKRGYYFANSRDAYFRNNVVLTTPDAVIKSDTLRYNSTSKIAYFYGPTNIYGKDDTLYTENGTYNTLNDQARFGKKNLYTQGNKSLKGDSLFYDRNAGYGRAMGNITFIDATENITFKGEMGLYNKKGESIMATKNAYLIITTESDSAKVDSIYMTADTLFSKMVLNSQLNPAQKEKLKKDNELQEVITDSTNNKVVKPVITAKLPTVAKLSRKQKKLAAKNQALLKDSSAVEKPSATNTKIDSSANIKIKNSSSDSVRNADSLSKKPQKISPAQKKLKPAKISTKKKSDSVKTPAIVKPKSTKVKLPADTAKTRVVMAYHRAKIFKSDLQARADSMFFSYGDSTIRCYVNPMIWTQGSQLSGDTVYFQLKNKKLDNMLLQHNSFIVNTAEGDSTHFNQIKGKVITGIFAKGKLDRMFVDGNAESIYYIKEDSAYTGLNRMLSSRIKVVFKDSKLNDIISILKPEGNFYPIDKIPPDEDILKGFIWKPKERPKSKKAIIPSRIKKQRLKIPGKNNPVTKKAVIIAKKSVR